MAAVKQKKRGQVNRSRTKLLLIAAEGRNKTEKLYFHELFQNQLLEFGQFRIAISGFLLCHNLVRFINV